jgi:uncharacterized protein
VKVEIDEGHGVTTTLAIARWIRNLSQRGEFALVTLLCFGVPIGGAVYLFVRGTISPITNARTVRGLLFEVVLGGAAAVVLALRGWKWHHFRLRIDGWNILAGGLLGLAYVGFAMFSGPLLIRVLPWLRPSPARQMHLAAAPALYLVFIVVNSIFEEVFVNAYAVQALERLDSRHPIVWSAALRASYHIYQGVLGPLIVFVLGLVMAAIFVRRRDLGIPVIGHTGANVLIFILRPGR